MRAPSEAPSSHSALAQGRAPLPPTDDEALAWALLRALASRARLRPLMATVGLDLGADQRVHEAPLQRAWIMARPDLPSGWSSQQRLDPAAARLLDLYMPLCVGKRSQQLILAHLGQSADGHLATFSGQSKFITGHDDIRHTHRLRALFDAVLVGASTVAVDDPMLTTRLVSGESPVRVILDPKRRLPAYHTVFSDQAARTMIVIDAAHFGTAPGALSAWPAHVETLALPTVAGCFDLHALLTQLRARGLQRVFIEGGGVTVAGFLQAGLLDRLQLAIAPVVLGPGPAPLSSSSRLNADWLNAHAASLRRFALGSDVLLDAALVRQA